jgi:hypothetical protein
MKNSFCPWIALVCRRSQLEYYAARERLAVAAARGRSKNPAHVVDDDSGHWIASIPSSGKTVKHTLGP